MQDTDQYSCRIDPDAHHTSLAYSKALFFRLACDRRVGATGFRIFIAMLATGLRGKYVQTSQRALAHDLKMTQATVSRGCAQLVAVGALDRVSDTGRYIINPHIAYGGSLESSVRARRYYKSQHLTERAIVRIIKDLGNSIAPDDTIDV